MEETKRTYGITRLLQEIESNAKDRAYLATLRQGLSETTQMRAWEYLIPICNSFEEPSKRFVWCTVAGLAAIVIPDGLATHESWNNLGTTMRDLAKGTNSSDVGAALKTFEPKFRRLLACHDTVELCEIVVGIGRTAVNKGVSINLEKLFWDLWTWDEPNKREETQLRWAKQFFYVFDKSKQSEVKSE